jgi:preprotein translocase subunit YajC
MSTTWFDGLVVPMLSSLTQHQPQKSSYEQVITSILFIYFSILEKGRKKDKKAKKVLKMLKNLSKTSF